jgi:hypothetical protein
LRPHFIRNFKKLFYSQKTHSSQVGFLALGNAFQKEIYKISQRVSLRVLFRIWETSIDFLRNSNDDKVRRCISMSHFFRFDEFLLKNVW